MFSPKTLEFISENHWMNSKEWFAAHKAEYAEFVQKPLVELSNALASTVEAIDPRLVTDPRSSVSRIYRDMRFARGSLYRDTLWISFRRDKQAYPCWPEFYFVLTPNEFFYGCGYYCAKSETMSELRRLIAEGDSKFLAAKSALEAQDEFVLEGELYKRSRHKDQPEVLRNWLDRKVICFSCHPEAGELFAPDLAERISAAFVSMKPAYELFIRAEEAVLNNLE